MVSNGQQWSAMVSNGSHHGVNDSQVDMLAIYTRSV